MSKLPRIQDDLYQAVNGEWLETAVIPDDKPLTGGFADLDEGVEKLLMKDFDAFVKKEKTTDVEAMGDAVALYQLATDQARRDEEGAKPVFPLLERINAIKDIDDLSENAKALSDAGVPLPFQCGVDVAMDDATKHAFIVLGPNIILPDTTYYDDKHPAKKKLLGAYEEMTRSVLAFAPINEEERDIIVKDMFAFDALVAKCVKSQIEWADYVKNHNPMPLEEVARLLSPFDFKGLLGTIYGEKIPETIIVYDPRAIQEFHTYFNQDTFLLYKHWAYAKTMLAATKFLSLELRGLGGSYRRALMGIAKDPTLEKDAYRMVSRYFSEPIGVYYGRTYFGEEAKKDVINLVKEIIKTYKKRISNGFLSDSTKEKAILKLSTIEIKMGYPDFVHEIYIKSKVDPKDSYFQAVCKLEALRSEDNYNQLYKEVDRSEWGMPGHMVNACYNPSMNDITFPAAILQKPFYSLHQKVEENLGGIGAVIGHEISHAFDNNGAQFDEKGCLAQWWTEEDYEAFKKVTKDMIDQFDGIEIHGGKVSGELVVSENIADNGGMAVTLEIMSEIKDADYQSYFKNWARVWCRKAKEEYMNFLLQNDVHSPAELRANMQPRNFKEWYESFGVTSSDQMYIAPEKRIIIW